MTVVRTSAAALTLLTLFSIPPACGGDDGNGTAGGRTADSGRGLEETGQPCTTAAECFQGLVEGGTIRGEAQCLTRVEGGYCTHLCTADDDCCAVAGECKTDLRQVCSPFESTGLEMCFLSCEDADIQAHEADLRYFTDGGTIDSSAFCAARAGKDFICRSSGGGTANRKVCVPGGGGSGMDAGVGDGGGRKPGRP